MPGVRSASTGAPVRLAAGTGQCGDASRRRAARRARLLAWLSLAYMCVEGAVGILAAVLAGSVALMGFGLDSAIEGRLA